MEQRTPEDDPDGSADRPLLSVRDIHKSYDDEPALKGISFDLFGGDILGLLGPNGAGKTTLLRILATITKPSSGTALIDGKPVHDVEHARKKLGYMPDFIGSYDELTVDECMEFFARAYLVPPDRREFAKSEALKTTGLQDLMDRPVGALSRGEARRLALARLLMHDPPLLLLDEPAAGLDSKSRVHLRDILKELQSRGKSIIVSSQVLEDVSDLTNKIGVIDQGVLLALGSTERLLSRLRSGRRWKVRLRDVEETERLRDFLKEREEVREVQYHGDHLLLTFSGGEELTEQIHQTLSREGFRVLEFAEQALGLEELYLRITGESS